ncbi:hypothetical protein REH77_11110 [Vibrio alginolyticus]
MDNKRDIFNAFFKAQDRFLLAAPHGFEPDVIHDYIHWGMVLSSCYEHIHTPLFCLKRYYYQFEQGDVKFLALQQQLRLIQISLD